MDPKHDSNQPLPRSPRPSRTLSMGGSPRASGRRSSVASGENQSPMDVARQIGAQTLQRHAALNAGKAVLPSPTLLRSRQPRSNILDPRSSPQSSATTIRPTDIEPWKIERGRVFWYEYHTKQHIGSVASFLYELLTLVDQALYSEGDVDRDLLNHLCDSINGIPQTILARFANAQTPLTRSTNAEPTTKKEEENDARESLYASEMGEINKNENIPITALYRSEPLSMEVKKEDPVFALPPRQATVRLQSPLSSLFRSKSSTQTSSEEADQAASQHDIPTVRDLSATEKRILEMLIAKGNITQAIQKIEDILQCDGPTEENFDGDVGLACLLSLHSAEDNLDNLAVNVDFIEENGNAKVLIHTEEQMRTIFNKLNAKASPDAAGWSVHLIVECIKQQPAILTLIMRFINGCLLHKVWPDFLFDCRIIAIPKPDRPDHYRPITIVSTWRKIISKALLCIHEQQLCSEIPPVLFGVGQPYGTETLISMLQAQVDTAIAKQEETVIVQIDLSSAYNHVRRQKMLDILAQHQLPLCTLSYFEALFKREKLFYFESDQVQQIPNTRGISQGESWSPLLFTLFMGRIIGETKAKQHSPPPGSSASSRQYLGDFLAYLDDVFILAPNMEIAQNTFLEYSKCLVCSGMEINTHKTRFFHLMPDGNVGTDEYLLASQEAQPQSTTTTTTSSSAQPAVNPGSLNSYAISSCSRLKILGSLLTLDQKERDDFFQAAADKAIKIMTAASQLHLQHFLLLSRLCVVSRLIQLIRTLPISEQVLNAFDRQVIALICYAFHLPQTAILELIHTPISVGGLGIQPLVTLQLPLACQLIQILCETEPFLSVAHNFLKTQPADGPTEEEIPPLFVGYLPLAFKFPPGYTLKKMLASAKPPELMDVHKKWVAQAVSDLQKDVRLQQNKTAKIHILALLKSSSTATWLQLTPLRNYQRLSDTEMLHSMWYRLCVQDQLFRYVSSLPELVFRGQVKMKDKKLLCPVCGFTMGPYHYANCQCNTAIRTSRHSIIKRILGRVLEEVGLMEVTIEDYSVGKTPGKNTIVPDITIRFYEFGRVPTRLVGRVLNMGQQYNGQVIFGIDIVIADIHAKSNESAHLDGLFAEAAEREKLMKYENHNKREDRIPIIPFGLSSIGEYGPTANEIIYFIREMVNRSDHPSRIDVERMKQQISLLLETSRSEMEQSYQQQLRLVIRTRMDAAKSATSEHDELGALLAELAPIPASQRQQSFWPRTIENVERFISTHHDASIRLAVRPNEQVNKTEQKPPKSESQDTLKLPDTESCDDDDDDDDAADPFGTPESQQSQSPKTKVIEGLAEKISMSISVKKKEAVRGEIEEQRAAKDQARSAAFSVRPSKSPLRNSKESGFAGHSLAQMKQRMQQLQEARDKPTEPTPVQIRYAPPQPKRHSRSPRATSKSPPSAVATSPLLRETGSKPQTSNRTLFDSLLAGKMRITGDPDPPPATSRSQSHSLLMKLGQRQHSISSPSIQPASPSSTTPTPTTPTTTTSTTTSSGSSSSPSSVTPSIFTRGNQTSISSSPSPSLLAPTSPSLSTPAPRGQINVPQYMFTPYTPPSPKKTKKGASQTTQPYSTPLVHQFDSPTLPIDDIQSPEIPPSSIRSNSFDPSTPKRPLSPTQRDPSFLSSSPFIQPQMPFHFMALPNQYPAPPPMIQRTTTGTPFGGLPLPTGSVLPVPIQTPSLFSDPPPPLPQHPLHPTYPSSDTSSSHQ